MTLSGQNITIAYENLDLQAVDTRRIKGFLKKAMVADIPDMIVVIDPTGPLIIQLGDRRIRTTFQRKSVELFNLWDIAFSCHQLVNDAKLVAYGFNYDISVSIQDENIVDKIMQMFAPCSNEISPKLGGELISVTPRIKFRRDQALYDLILEPVKNNQLAIHLNIHFQFNGVNITPDLLKEHFTSGYEYLKTLIPSLLIQ